MNELPSAKQLAWTRCAWLSVATALLWLAMAGPAWYLAGRAGLVGLSWAAVLCVVPGWAVFWMAAAYGTAGTQVPLVILGGTTLRILFVLLGLVIVQSADPRLGFREFVVWLLVFYLGLLAVETSLALLPPTRSGLSGAGFWGVRRPTDGRS